MHIETERKFLIYYPDIKTLTETFFADKKEIVQTYLNSEKGSTSRVRKVISEKGTRYIRTEKRRISFMSAFEDESEISLEEYEKLLLDANKELKPIFKTRYSFPYKEHVIEIDVYPFWDDRAVLEIEMKDESEKIEIPQFIKAIKEVTEDKRYKNVNLARSIPNDEINFS